MKTRRNEKKYHTELVNIAKDDVNGWGFKAQRGFVGGMPDVELKVPHLPLVKIEIKHEVYAKILPPVVPISLTILQRTRLRDMQKANLSCGWASFINIGKRVVVVYSTNPRTATVCIEFNTYKDKWQVRAVSLLDTPACPVMDHYMEIEEWIKGQKIAVFSKMLNLLTRPQLYSQAEGPTTETSPLTPKLLSI